MVAIFQVLNNIMGAFPPPIFALIGLVVFIAILTALLKLIKLILDAIPFV